MGAAAEFVNALLDIALAICWRLFDFPLSVILFVAIVTSAAGTLAYTRLSSAPSASLAQRKQRLMLLSAVVAAFVVLSLLDVRMRELDRQSKIPHALSSGIPVPSQRPDMFLYRAQVAQLHGAVRYSRITNDEPRISAYLVEIDLKNENLTMVLNPDPSSKILTSDFAKQQNCDIAINGEAGLSPNADTGFGRWQGPYVVDGKIVLNDTAESLPYLSFNRNRFAAQVPDLPRTPADLTAAYQVVWGRWDLLRNREFIERPRSNRYPRTIMGIDKNNQRLFLLVADGRDGILRIGMSPDEAAAILLERGATDAMLCDQGGSSTLYIRELGGVVNSPSDGTERPVYTHFGIRYQSIASRE